MRLLILAITVSAFTTVRCASSVLLPSHADNLTNINVIIYSGPTDGSEKVILANPMYMQGVPISTLFVAENGIIGLNGPCEYITPDVMPPKTYCYDNPFIAPYWADVDVTTGINPDGYISYYTLAASGAGKSMIKTLIEPAVRDISGNADIDSAIVVTWYSVAFATRYSGVPTNTFQVIVASSSKIEKSYVMFNYEQLTWTGGMNTNSDMHTGLGGSAMPLIGITTGNPANYVELEYSGTASFLNNTERLSVNIAQSENPPAGRWLHATHLFPDKILLGKTKVQAYKTEPHCNVNGDPHVIMFDYKHNAWNPQLDTDAGPSLLAAPCMYHITMGTYHWSVWFKTYKPSSYSIVNQVFVKFISNDEIVTINIDGRKPWYQQYGDNAVSLETSKANGTRPLFRKLQHSGEYSYDDPSISIKYDGWRYVTVVYEDQMRVSISLWNEWTHNMLEPIDVYINKYGSTYYKCNMAGLCGNMNGKQDEVVSLGKNIFEYLCIDDHNRCQSVKPGVIWPYVACENNCWSRLDIFTNPRPYFHGTHHNLCYLTNYLSICSLNDTSEQVQFQETNFKSAGEISASCSDAIDNACGPLLDPSGPLGQFILADSIVTQNMYATCVADLCMMGVQAADTEACGYFEQAVRLIKRDNILLHDLSWRTSGFCGIAKSCPVRMHYESCGSACPMTCTDRTSYFACTKGCQEGCFCDTGLVANGGICIEATECGCTDLHGYFHMINSTWITSSCDQICSCVATTSAPECKTIAQCDPNASCRLNDADNDQSILCQCRAGFIGNGYTCIADPCSSNPCQAGATCTATASGEFECTCPPLFTGQRCETSLDYCVTSQRCMNGASCTNTDTGYSCTCPEGFTGPLCQFFVNHCNDSPCQQGACISDPVGFHCDCVSWYTGQYCDTRIDHCHSNPCLNGGACYDSPLTSYACNCTTNAFGFNCDKLITPPPGTGMTTMQTSTLGTTLPWWWTTTDRIPVSTASEVSTTAPPMTTIMPTETMTTTGGIPATMTAEKTTANPPITTITFEETTVTTEWIPVSTSSEKTTTTPPIATTMPFTTQGIPVTTSSEKTTTTPPIATTMRSGAASTTRISDGSTATPDCSGNQFQCYGHPDGNYAIPNCQCASYYITCSNNNRYIMPCPAGIYYNAATDQCSACLV